ncbi:MAG: hypothetical protein KGO96_14135 [Elusimicrobia bacterium]|nr:hypothetical protein [Elusimicrobiota bacterium]
METNDYRRADFEDRYGLKPEHRDGDSYMYVTSAMRWETWKAAIDAHLARQSEGVSEEDVRRAWMAYTGRNRLGAAYEKDYEQMLPEERKAMRAALTAVWHNRPAREKFGQQVSTVYLCSNANCQAVHEVDPCGHCPACVSPSGVGWSTIPRKLYRSDQWAPYLKDGQTPFERFMQEVKDCEGAVELLRQARLKDESAQEKADPVAVVRHFDYRGIAKVGLVQEAQMLEGAPVIPDGTKLYTHPAAERVRVPEDVIEDLRKCSAEHLTIGNHFNMGGYLNPENTVRKHIGFHLSIEKVISALSDAPEADHHD